MFAVLLIVLGALLILAGFVGCILPVLPGPPLAYLGFIALWAARGFEANTFTWVTAAVLGVSMVLVTIVDTVAPAIGARRYGATKAGMWLSVLGMVIGIIFFPPLGMILGAFLGALMGELLASKPLGEALKASWGVFVYTFFGILLKVVVVAAITWYFVVELVS